MFVSSPSKNYIWINSFIFIKTKDKKKTVDKGMCVIINYECAVNVYIIFEKLKDK